MRLTWGIPTVHLVFSNSHNHFYLCHFCRRSCSGSHFSRVILSVCSSTTATATSFTTTVSSTTAAVYLYLFVVLLLQWLLVLLLLLVLQLLQCSWFYSNYCFSYIYYFYDCNSYWFYYYYSTTALHTGHITLFLLLFPTPPLTPVTLIDLSWLSTNAIFCKSIKCRLKAVGDI